MNNTILRLDFELAAALKRIENLCEALNKAEEENKKLRARINELEESLNDISLEIIS